MKLLNKTSLALALSIFGAASTMSALAVASADKDELRQLHRIEVIAGDSEQVKVFVNANGETTNVSLTKDALQDRAQLEAALVDVPEELREKLLNSLDSLHLDTKVIDIDGLVELGEGMSLLENSSGENVFVVKIDGDESEHSIASTVVRELKHSFKHGLSTGDKHRVIEFKHRGKLGADSVVRMLEHGKYSAEELNKIQQALDAKR